MLIPEYCTHFPTYVKKGHYQRSRYEAALFFDIHHRVAVDIGAHVGFWTNEMAKDYSDVYAFEPETENYHCLVKNVPATVHTYNVALSEHEAKGEMISPKHVNSGAWELHEGKGNTRITTLDSYQLNPDLVKIDVQGHEMQVINGAIETILRAKPIIIIETIMNGQENYEIYELLQYLGMTAIAKMKKDTIFAYMHKLDEKIRQYLLNNQGKFIGLSDLEHDINQR